MGVLVLYFKIVWCYYLVSHSNIGLKSRFRKAYNDSKTKDLDRGGRDRRHFPYVLA